MGREKFCAPWGRTLTATTAVCLLILLGILILGLSIGPQDLLIWRLAMIVLPLSVLIIAPLFSIRGYVVNAESILVLRPGWKTVVKLAGLVSAIRDSTAMSRSIRTFGNGGLFCIAGAFHNRKRGAYRAFATDPEQAVILTFTDRTIVLTPDRPDEFIVKIRTMRGLAG
jgi:hypothetical protein